MEYNQITFHLKCLFKHVLKMCKIFIIPEKSRPLQYVQSLILQINMFVTKCIWRNKKLSIYKKWSSLLYYNVHTLKKEWQHQLKILFSFSVYTIYNKPINLVDSFIVFHLRPVFYCLSPIYHVLSGVFEIFENILHKIIPTFIWKFFKIGQIQGIMFSKVQLKNVLQSRILHKCRPT